MGPGSQGSQPKTWRFSGSPNVRGDTLIRFPPPRNALALADEGVRPALPAEARGAAMARHGDDVVAEGPERHAAHEQQRRAAAARPVAPAHRPADQQLPAACTPACTADITQMAGGMAAT